MRNKYRELFSNTLIFSAGNVVSKLILSLLLPYFTRVLTTDDFGTAELLLMISQLTVPVCSLAIQDAVFRFLMDSTKNKEAVLKNGFFILKLSSFLVIAIGFFLSFYAPLQEWYLYYILISIFNMFRSVLSLYAKSVNKTIIFSIDNIVYNFSLAVFSVFMLSALKTGLLGYFLALIFADLMSIVFLSYNLKLDIELFDGVGDKELLNEMLFYSMPLVLNSISWGMTHVVDRVMLTSMCSMGANGIYSAASKIPSLLTLVTGVFTQAWTLSMIQDYGKEKDIHFYKIIFDITHISVSILFFIIIIFNATFMDVILGKEFLNAVRYVPVLLLGVVFLTYSNYFSSIYGARKDSKKIMTSSLCGGIINFVLNYFLIPLFGIMGACIATATSYMFIGVFRAIDSELQFPIKIDFLKFFLSAIMMILCTLVCSYSKGLTIVLFALIGIGMICRLYNDIVSRVLFLLSERVLAKIRK